jgi:hypothetical protein
MSITKDSFGIGPPSTAFSPVNLSAPATNQGALLVRGFEFIPLTLLVSKGSCRTQTKFYHVKEYPQRVWYRGRRLSRLRMRHRGRRRPQPRAQSSYRTFRKAYWTGERARDPTMGSKRIPQADGTALAGWQSPPIDAGATLRPPRPRRTPATSLGPRCVIATNHPRARRPSNHRPSRTSLGPATESDRTRGSLQRLGG